MTTPQSGREAFESWARTQTNRIDALNRKGDGYVITTAQIMWLAWQAALARTEAEQGDALADHLEREQGVREDAQRQLRELQAQSAENARIAEAVRGARVFNGGMMVSRSDDFILIPASVLGGEEPICTCPSGDGSLRWPCPKHPPNAMKGDAP